MRSYNLIVILLLIETPFLLTGWYLFFQDKTFQNKPVEHVAVVQKQNVFQIMLPHAKQSQLTSDQNLAQKHRTKFKGLDFQDLLDKIRSNAGQNLLVRITDDPQTKNQRVAINSIQLAFPQMIDISKTNEAHQSKKYAYVHYQYNDQLTKNTRAFLSLCAQAGRTGRKVVKPFVRQTKLSSAQSWLPLETYYDVKQLDRLLAAAGYATLVNTKEYLNECPPNSSDHVSIHFIDNSQSSMGFAKGNFRLKEDYYKAIVKNSSQTGWTECAFLDKAMKRTPGKQFCVNAEIIKDWNVFERDIVKNKKCLNIFIWRGIDGITYRLKFSENDMKYSSIDLSYSLKPGQPIVSEVERFTKESLAEQYIAVYVRAEFIMLRSTIDELRKCIDLMLEVVTALKTTTGLSRVYVATDMGDNGSASLIRLRMRRNLDENVFKDLHSRIVDESNGVAYTPPSYVQDRGVMAFVDMNLISRAQYLISVGSGTFQAWTSAKFLHNHRNDKQLWSKITVCEH